MKSKHDLFELIESLTKAEKRYFKISANRYGNKASTVFLDVFDLISKQKVKNDADIAKALKSKISPNQLAVTKSNLYEAILSSLADQHKKKSIDVSERLSQVSVLKKKGLLNQAKERVALLQRDSELLNPSQNLEVLDVEIDLEMTNSDFTDLTIVDG